MADDKEIHVGDTINLFLHTEMDLTGYSALTVKVDKKDLTGVVDSVVWTPTVDDLVAGILLYVTLVTDLDIPGMYSCQIEAYFSDGRHLHSTIDTFRVDDVQ